jgi:hypothetical protein
VRPVTRLANHRALTQMAEADGLNGNPVTTVGSMAWVPLEGRPAAAITVRGRKRLQCPGPASGS